MPPIGLAVRDRGCAAEKDESISEYSVLPYLNSKCAHHQIPHFFESSPYTILQLQSLICICLPNISLSCLDLQATCTMTKPLPFLPYSPKSFNFPMCALTFWPQSLKVWMKSAKEGGIDSFARNQDSTSYLSPLFYIHLTVHLSPELLQPFPCGILTSISQYTVLLKRYSLSANFNQPGIRDTLHITSHTVICM